MPSVSSETQGISDLVKRSKQRLEPPVPTDTDLWLVTDDGARELLTVLTVKEAPRAIVREQGRVAILALGVLHPEKFIDRGERIPAFDQSSFDVAVLLRSPTAEERQTSPYRARTKNEVGIGAVASKVFELLEVVEDEETVTPAGVVLLGQTGVTEPYIQR